MRPLTDDELAALSILSTRHARQFHRDLEHETNARHAWGTIGTDILLRPTGEIVEHCWSWEDDEAGRMGRVRLVDDAQQRARILLVLAVETPALARLSAEEPVGCAVCRGLLLRGILILECGDHASG